MLGWWILVDAQTPEERDRAEDHKARLLASWETGLGGDAWVLGLVREGKAQEYRLAGGYPNRYTALAGDVLPLLAAGPPIHRGADAFTEDEESGEVRFLPGDWKGRVTLHRDRMDACAPDQPLTIDLWDLS